MSITETVQTQLKAIFTADTGSAGLNNSTSANYVRFWAPYRDPFVDQANGPGNWPAVLTKVDVQSMHSSDWDKYRVRVSFVMRHDRQVAQADATVYGVANQINIAFNNVTMTNLNDWYFSPFHFMDEVEGSRNTVTLEQILVAECYAGQIS